ncbi:NAD(P)H-binding protein [Amycolatopsis sp. NBC_01488]|uniref:NmrA family NAD(P)-binding protein n=1 Tax=Amycolatopsis sp. NBC_01488 TaxID=2903563 RepID=UPI002E2A08C8|nr:NAD(P)H-binding protein [Amycolatopsis sp. NBC_01488]
MIVITGGSGKLGSQVVERLLRRVPAEQVGVSVREPGRATGLAERGVRVRRGDFADPDSLASAFEGATQVLVVSTDETGEEARRHHAAAIDAARDAGAKRVLYTSHQAAAGDSLFAPMSDHAAAERHLAAAGPAFTALRNGFYAATVPLLLGQARETGELVAPADGPVSWTAHADLAEAAAVVLADEGRFDGPTPPLTAPVALDLEDVAGLLSGSTGRTIRRVVADDDEWVAGLTAHGVPEGQAAMLLGMFRAARRGEFATTGSDLEDLLGRPATPLRAILG